MAKGNETTTAMVSLRLESRMKEGVDMLDGVQGSEVQILSLRPKFL